MRDYVNARLQLMALVLTLGPLFAVGIIRPLTAQPVSVVPHETATPTCAACFKRGITPGRIYEVPGTGPARWNRYWEEDLYHLHEEGQRYQCSNGDTWAATGCWCGWPLTERPLPDKSPVR